MVILPTIEPNRTDMSRVSFKIIFPLGPEFQESEDITNTILASKNEQCFEGALWC